MKILIVEDDLKIANFIAKGLKEASYTTVCSNNGKEALDYILHDSTIDLIILDLMIPIIDGLEVLKTVRAANILTPILILSAKRSVDEKVLGLQHGADDYLEKPFSFSELLARIQVLLRRSQGQMSAPTKLEKYGIEINLLNREVRRENELIELQPKEFNLLEYFLNNPDRVLSKTMILEKIYHYSFDTQTNIVDVLVCRLRNKIDKDFSKKTIHTIRGIGYVFKED